MKLTEKQKQQLRRIAHHRRVIIIIGQHGVTSNVISEIDLALQHHELVKVRVNASDRELRRKMIHDISEKTNSHVIQAIGHIGVFYRPSDRPVIDLSGG